MKDSIDGIDYSFGNPELLEEALTHRSIGATNYERLEFLGDSILSMVVSSRLYERFPQSNEGDLTRMRARLVRGTTLAEVAKSLNLDRQIRLGEGERKSGSFRRTSILADSFEALIGAIFLDGGYDACRRVLLDRFDPLIDSLPHIDELKDAKTRLQEWLQARGRPLPEYTLVREEGPDHAKQFFVACRLQDDGTEVRESGGSRRKAEQAAAKRLYAQLQDSEAS